MGAPVSPALAELVMHELCSYVEKKLYFTTPFLEFYVDDTIVSTDTKQKSSTYTESI